MGFYTRPNLEDTTFKQLAGSQLTLSGETRIATTSGLTLADGLGGYIPITLSGASLTTDKFVLTYRDDIKKVVLMSGGTGGDGLYTCASPTTCTVGGLAAGTSIANCSISKILETILVPALVPTLTAPFATFTVLTNPVSPSLVFEIGSSISVTGTTTLNRGTVSPVYCSGASTRIGSSSCYDYTSIWGTCSIISSSSPNSVCFLNQTVNTNNTVGSIVCYLSGETAYNCAGAPYGGVCPSGTFSNSQPITGLYPYFYGKVGSCGSAAGANRPTPTVSLITGGTKIVASSVGTINVTFNSSSDDYIWFAIPNASASKTKWYVDALNNGTIGGVVSAGGNLFPAENSVTGVGTIYWSGQTYKLYISNYQSASTSVMQLKNS